MLLSVPHSGPAPSVVGQGTSGGWVSVGEAEVQILCLQAVVGVVPGPGVLPPSTEHGLSVRY